MLRSMKDLENYAIGAKDGSIGHVKDFFFDDEAWVIRYLVVETGTWLSSRKVLISPIAIHAPNWTEKLLPVSITRDQVKNSPDIDTDKPVSRQHETTYLGYYGYPYYWGGAGLWASGAYPYAMFPGYVGNGEGRKEAQAANLAYVKAERATHGNDDPHLRSCKAVVGYHIHATDGEIGHVSGFLVDEHTWALRYVIIDTSNWWVGHQVLISPEWIDSVSWTKQTVSIDLSRQSVKDAPVYDATKQLNRDHERGLYHHYERSGYWSNDTANEPDRLEAYPL
ncbi:MAG: PRC-barrel domain-containing protein [Nevskia sp.]|nr:PRC-barrel domain-containing protein [Nevskia sp.]